MFPVTISGTAAPLFNKYLMNQLKVSFVNLPSNMLFTTELLLPLEKDRRDSVRSAADSRSHHRPADKRSALTKYPILNKSSIGLGYQNTTGLNLKV
jgi:hypothetical protein